jgi:hypothetical protein
VGVVDVERFVADGFVKLEEAAPRPVADAARSLLWRQIGLSPDEQASWREPVIWASDLTGEGALGEVIKSPRLAQALDEVCGPGGWRPRPTLGMVPVRFPRLPGADDRGWHIDANAAAPDGSYRCGARSQTMLLLVLLSEVGPADAPTRIRTGSQRDAAAALGDRLLDPFAAGPVVDAASAGRPLAYATGRPGDVYLVHPLTVHAADEHRGSEPRFMAQTPVFLASPLTPDGDTALARAIAAESRLLRGRWLVDADHVARGVAHGEVPGAPRLVGRLLDDLAARGADRGEGGVDVVGFEVHAVQRALGDKAGQRVDVGRAAVQVVGEDDADFWLGGGADREPAELAAGDVVAQFESERVAVELQCEIWIVD